MFHRCLTRGSFIREKDRIPLGWCFRTQPREEAYRGRWTYGLLVGVLLLLAVSLVHLRDETVTVVIRRRDGFFVVRIALVVLRVLGNSVVELLLLVLVLLGGHGSRDRRPMHRKFCKQESSITNQH